MKNDSWAFLAICIGVGIFFASVGVVFIIGAAHNWGAGW